MATALAAVATETAEAEKLRDRHAEIVLLLSRGLSPEKVAELLKVDTIVVMLVVKLGPPTPPAPVEVPEAVAPVEATVDVSLKP